MDTSFVEELASAAPTPGGGGASAYCGALACALASMVGNLTVGKKTYAQVEPEVYMRLEKLADLRGRLLGLVGADAEAFGPLAAAYRMPKDTPEQLEAKQAAIQDALVGATEVPLDIMRMARSDAGVSVAFARAAVDGASLNVYINAASIDDAERAARYRDEADRLVAQTREHCDEVFAFVKDAVS